MMILWILKTLKGTKCPQILKEECDDDNDEFEEDFTDPKSDCGSDN